MKKLVIVESPTKAKTIRSFLGSEVTVMASMGHIRDIPDKGMNVDLETFKPKYEISADKKDLVRELKNELRDSDELFLATDEDREGESISWHLREVLKPKVPVRRMVFHEITEKAIRRAFGNTRQIDMNMVFAQESRRVLDRIFGYKVSPRLWTCFGSNHLSAGRVQSPALKLVVDREYRRLSFKSASYNIVKAVFSTAKGEEFEAKLYSINDSRIVSSKSFFNEDTGELVNPGNILLDDSTVGKFYDAIRNGEYVITEVAEKEVRISPPVPFITSTLQQDSNTKLHFSASETMVLAQRLYEKGFITYMRTDSPSLSSEGTEAARVTAERIFSADMLSDKERVFKSKDQNAQNAHEAIRPAVIDSRFRNSDELDLDDKEARLYDLIFRRTVACQMKENIRKNTNVRIRSVINGDEFVFSASGHIDVQQGFRMAYVTNDSKSDDDTNLPDLSEGEKVQLKSSDVNKTQTIPPKRWTEASLIKELERIGIGRPSTYAAIINALTSRNYVKKVDNALVPTFVGFIIVKFLDSHLSSFIDYRFTSKMEEGLDLIEQNSVDKFDFLKNFYSGKDGLEGSLDFKVENKKEESELVLPTVSDAYKVYVGKYGPYFTFNGENHSIPRDMFPYQISDAKLEEICNAPEVQPQIETVATDPQSGKEICFNPNGKFGAYFFIKDEKKYVSLPKGSSLQDWSEEEIVKMFALPLVLGKDSDGNEAIVNRGKFGLYVSYKGKNKSVKDVHKALSFSFDEAVGVFEGE